MLRRAQSGVSGLGVKHLDGGFHCCSQRGVRQQDRIQQITHLSFLFFSLSR
eukprot:m.231812 g.231812  ORF g.231812 m.231812 type:complete len:51 (+) comp18495_c0_seq1:1715-1867(+)